MPARHEADILRELEIIEHETRGKVEGARQLKFPTLTLVGNSNGKRAVS
jgi:ribosomal protein S5